MTKVPEILKRLMGFLDRHERVALVTILGLRGSGPRRAGSKMLVPATGPTVGTIGGGWLESEALQSAREVLTTGRFQLRTLSLSQEEASESGMICGGTVDLLVECLDGADPELVELFRQVTVTFGSHRPGFLVTVVERNAETMRTSHTLLDAHGQWLAGNSWAADWQSWRERMVGRTQPILLQESNRLVFIDPLNPPKTVWIFGGGHLAESLAPLCAQVDFRVVVLDDREEFATASRFPTAAEVQVVPSFATAMKSLPIRTDGLVVIVTRGHLWDQVVLAQALRTEAAYIGMIGSRRKRDATYRALAEEGFSSTELQRVHCPIGLPIGAETPQEIAISIVAELIAARAGLERSL